jgi:hypothetical protein
LIGATHIFGAAEAGKCEIRIWIGSRINVARGYERHSDYKNTVRLLHWREEEDISFQFKFIKDFEGR